MNTVHQAALAGAEPYEIEPGRWIAEFYPCHAGVWAVGESPDACRATLAEVVDDWLTVKRSHGDNDIPAEEASDSVAARKALAESDEVITYEQVRRERGL